jgi:hypothetical protein
MGLRGFWIKWEDGSAISISDSHLCHFKVNKSGGVALQVYLIDFENEGISASNKLNFFTFIYHKVVHENAQRH